MSELRPVRGVFRAVVETIVPKAERLEPAAWGEVEGLVEHVLAQRPAALRRQLRLLLRAVDLLALLTCFRHFAALGLAGRARVLRFLEDSPLALLRRGFWGLKTLALLGYYARPAAAREVGYRASPGGWALRR